MEIIDPIPVELDAADLAGEMNPPKIAEEFMALFEKARPLIEPKAALTAIRVSSIENDLVHLENGHILRGLVISDMLESGQEVMPYVVTIGPKLESEISAEKNLLHSFLLEKIGNYGLHQAAAYLRSLALKRLADGQGSVSDFSPGTGTGELFGIEQQKPLFAILDPVAATIGVQLKPSMLMVPRKSESGVLAATPVQYVACAHCPKAQCESRSTPFVGEYKRLKQP